MPSPRPLPLAKLPTPLETLDALGSELGVRLRIKRDDLTGSQLSGNKIRKLQYLLADAVASGASHVLTCGAVQSNHCRATALAAVPLGLQPILYLRSPRGLSSDLPALPEGNYLLNLLAGAEIRLCDPESYRQRTTHLARIADEIRVSGGHPYIIPEGGSNAVGALGYVDAARELADQWGSKAPDSVVVATGSGGTLAGLAIGLKGLGVPTRAVGIAVCDDEATFRSVVHAISEEATQRYDLPRLKDEDFVVIDSHVGRGYGLSTPEELHVLRDLVRSSGIVLDPVYSAKAFKAVCDISRQRPLILGKDIVFIHTGGIFGLLAAAETLVPHL